MTNEAENITKSEFKYIQLIDKLEQNNEKLENKIKQQISENIKLSEESSNLKQQYNLIVSENNLLKNKLNEQQNELNLNSEKLKASEKNIISLSEEIKKIGDSTTSNSELLKLANEKAIQLQEIINSKEKEIITLNDNLTKLNNEINNSKREIKDISAPNVEIMIEQELNDENRIHRLVLMFLLKSKDLEDIITIGKMKLKRVFLGDGYYQLIE